MRNVLIIIGLVFLFGSCVKNISPTCIIITPKNNAEIEKGTIVTISADADDEDGNLSVVRFYVDDAIVSSSSVSPYSHSWKTSDDTIGCHTIKATAFDEDGEEATDNITVMVMGNPSTNTPPPQSAFQAFITSIPAGGFVSFTDQSTNSPTNWSWDFGDGSSSTLQNPQHIYSSEGAYTVTLTASNSHGSHIEQKIDYIKVVGQSCGIVTDINGNLYNTVQIGSQCWMASNLKASKYPDGTNIPLVTDNIEWANLGDNNTDDAYCFVNKNANNEADTYGALYTWAAAMGDNAVSGSNSNDLQGICPDGWHLPSEVDCLNLIDILGIWCNVGGKMKETGTSHWTSPNTDADNSSGFSALPSGTRDISLGIFSALGNNANFWLVNENDSTSAKGWWLSHDNPALLFSSFKKSYGFSVRCLKD